LFSVRYAWPATPLGYAATLTMNSVDNCPSRLGDARYLPTTSARSHLALRGPTLEMPGLEASTSSFDHPSARFDLLRQLIGDDFVSPTESLTRVRIQPESTMMDSGRWRRPNSNNTGRAPIPSVMTGGDERCSRVHAGRSASLPVKTDNSLILHGGTGPRGAAGPGASGGTA
jgi:hypothetical protein